MPLRDHFRPPLDADNSWEGLQGGWPMAIVQQLGAVLRPEFVARPRVHLGPAFEIDVASYERGVSGSWSAASPENGDDAQPSAWMPSDPVLLLESEEPSP